MEDIDGLVFDSFSSKYTVELCRLYDEVFNKKVEEDYFIIKYGLEIDPESQLCTVAIMNGRVIGFMGIIRQKFTRDGLTKILALGCDYILSKPFRGKSVFRHLHNHTIQKVSTQDIEGLYAFHSEQTYKASKKLGWKDEIGFSRFHISVYPFSTSRMIRIMGLNKWRNRMLDGLLRPYLTNLNINQLKRGERFEQIYNSIFFEKKAFFQHYLIEISGCILYLKYNYLLSIGFCHFRSTADIPNMIRTLRKICRQCLIHNVVFQVQSDSVEASILNTYITSQPSFRISSYSIKPIFSMSEIKLNFMDMDIF